MKRYLLDTNVLSELSRDVPHPAVEQFLAANLELWASVITIEELQMGVERLPLGRRRDRLVDWLESTVMQFENNLLGVGLREARWSGKIRARALSNGRGISRADALIAATAVSNDLCLATRNVKDFEFLSVDIMNPWEQA